MIVAFDAFKETHFFRCKYFNVIVVNPKMNVPAWLNRETVQMVLVVLVTAGFHYYFITHRLANSSADESSNNSLGDDESIILEQQTAQA